MSPLIDFDAITLESLYATGALKWSQPGKIGAFVAEMDYGPAPEIVEAVSGSIRGGRTGYLTPQLEAELKQATTGWLESQFGWQVPGEQVRLLPDVLAALGATLAHYTPADSPVIVTTPAYMPFVAIEKIWGRRVIEVPLQRDGERWVFDYDAIDAAFGEGAGLFVLCNPYNPVGRVLEHAELEAICTLVDKHGARVFNDEIHAPLVFDGRTHIPYPTINETAAAHTITAMSASKAWNLPGLKTAELVLSNPADLAVWEPIGLLIEHGASNPGIIANSVAFTQGLPWLDEVKGYVASNRTFFAAALGQQVPEIKVTVPEGTYLALMDCSALGLDTEPATFFEENANVIFTPGSACGEIAKDFARVNLATTKPILAEIVDRLASALAKRG